MNMKTKITSIFALALLITACSNDNDPINGGQGGEEKTEITLGTSIMTRASVESNQDGVITAPTSLDIAFLRAPDHTSSAPTSDVWAAAINTNQAEAGVGSGIVKAKLTNTTINGSAVNVLKFNTPQYYNILATQYSHLKGYYPEVALNKATYVSATWKIDGKTDVMVTEYFHQNKSITPNSVDLEFQHLLSKLTIKIIADSKAAADGWGNVTLVEIENLKSTVTHTFNGNDSDEYVATGAGSDNKISVFQANGDQVLDDPAKALPLSTSIATFGKALVYPEDAYDLIVTTTKGGAPVSVNVPITGSAQPGMDHEITLTFKSGEILPSIRVKPWEEGGKGSGTIQ